MELERAYYLVGKLVDGSISADERVEIGQWLSEDPARQELVADLKLILGAVEQQAPVVDAKTDQAWSEMMAKISPAETPVIDMQPKPSQGFSYWKFAVAASVALLVAVGGYYLLGGGPKGLDEAKTFATKAGERTSVTLPDGSKIHLNAGSTLTAEAGFGRKDRQVTLSGEAYFEVAHDPSKPFVVKTGEVKTTVLGTKFNLRNYRPADPVRLSVVEGKVKFAAENGASEGIFSANESGTFDPATRRVEKGADPASDIAAWRDGVLNFHDEALSTAIPRLNHFYDIDIRLGDGLQDARLTARFAETDATAMLDILAATYSVKVRREGKVAWLEK